MSHVLFSFLLSPVIWMWHTWNFQWHRYCFYSMMYE